MALVVIAALLIVCTSIRTMTSPQSTVWEADAGGDGEALDFAGLQAAVNASEQAVDDAVDELDDAAAAALMNVQSYLVAFRARADA